MRFSSLSLFSLMCSVLVCAQPLHAQESVAGGTTSNDAGWGALQTLINSTKNDIQGLRTDVNAGKACGKKNQIWNPDKGCVNSNVDLSDLEKIKACNKVQKFYSPTTAGADAKTGCVSTAVVEKGLWIDKGTTACGSTSLSTYKDKKSKGVACAKKPTAFSKCTDKGYSCYVDSTCGYVQGGGGSGNGGGNNGFNQTGAQLQTFTCQF